MSVTGAGWDHDVYVNSLSVLVCCCRLPESARPGAGKWRGRGGGGGRGSSYRLVLYLLGLLL